ADEPVDLGLVVAHGVGEQTRERVRVALERFLERPPEQVALVERPDGRPALVGAPHGLTPASPLPHAHARTRHARETYAPVRVSTRTRSPTSMKSGTFTLAPVSRTAGLVPPPEAVSPRRPGSVC